MKSERAEAGSTARLSCWFCGHRFTARHVLRDGILRSRVERSGGPYRLFVCPSCSRENVCERTLRGRWFASPNHRFSILDYLFTQVLDPAGAESLLAAISWFRENEERRRYFFETDGDRRYSGRSLLAKLWPVASAERVPGSGAPAGSGARRGASSGRSAHSSRSGASRARDSGAHSSGRGAPGGDRRSAGGAGGYREESRGRPAKDPHSIVSPYEVLGVQPGASEVQIRDAFHRLAIHYHPDKVHHLGEEFERVAKEKFQRLKDAYEVLLAARRVAR